MTKTFSAAFGVTTQLPHGTLLASVVGVDGTVDADLRDLSGKVHSLYTRTDLAIEFVSVAIDGLAKEATGFVVLHDLAIGSKTSFSQLPGSYFAAAPMSAEPPSPSEVAEAVAAGLDAESVGRTFVGVVQRSTRTASGGTPAAASTLLATILGPDGQAIGDDWKDLPDLAVSLYTLPLVELEFIGLAIADVPFTQTGSVVLHETELGAADNFTATGGFVAPIPLSFAPPSAADFASALGDAGIGVIPSLPEPATGSIDALLDQQIRELAANPIEKLRQDGTSVEKVPLLDLIEAQKRQREQARPTRLIAVANRGW